MYYFYMQRHKRIILILIICLGIFFRFFRLNEVPSGLYPDEAMNGNNGLEATATHDYKFFYPENNGREGFFINMQALSVAMFGRKPWALRGVSAVCGTLTILGIFLVTKELFSHRGNKRKRSAAATIGLLAAFFLATSYWHINFSRIGFRAIMLPLITTFALYFLLKGLRTKNIWTLVIAGFFTGLGFHTYIAFRFFPFLAAIPLLPELWNYYRRPRPVVPVQKKTTSWAHISRLPCGPCAVVLYLFATFVVALPIGVYFIQHPQDFISRSSQISIFATHAPIAEFITSNIKTAGMFFVRGDCNWRHNYNCQPELVWPVALFFVVGVFVTIRDIFKRTYERGSIPFVLIGWLIIMSLPATLTWEGMPHALRSIGMIPPVMILAAFGCWRLVRALLDWFERLKFRFTQRIAQIARIQKEIKIFFMLTLLLLPIYTYRSYFMLWANAQETYFAFTVNLYHLGQYIQHKPNDMTVYVIADAPGTEVRGIPMPAQTVMFVTDTFRESERTAKHIFYVRPDALDMIHVTKDEHVIFAFLNPDDLSALTFLNKKFPEFKLKAPGDFMIMENYY